MSGPPYEDPKPTGPVVPILPVCRLCGKRVKRHVPVKGLVTNAEGHVIGEKTTGWACESCWDRGWQDQIADGIEVVKKHLASKPISLKARADLDAALWAVYDEWFPTKERAP
jgi:hypothetical protein